MIVWEITQIENDRMGIKRIGIELDGNWSDWNRFGLEIIQIAIDRVGNDSDRKWCGLELVVYPY